MSGCNETVCQNNSRDTRIENEMVNVWTRGLERWTWRRRMRIHSGQNTSWWSRLTGCGIPWVVSKTFSALLGNPSQDGVWVSGSISTQCMNSSRLQHIKSFRPDRQKTGIHYSWTAVYLCEVIESTTDRMPSGILMSLCPSTLRASLNSLSKLPLVKMRSRKVMSRRWSNSLSMRPP